MKNKETRTELGLDEPTPPTETPEQVSPPDVRPATNEGDGSAPSTPRMPSAKKLWREFDAIFKKRLDSPTKDILLGVGYLRLKAVVSHGQFTAEFEAKYPAVAPTTMRKYRRGAESFLTALVGAKPDLKVLRQDPSPLFAPGLAAEALKKKLQEWNCESVADVRRKAAEVVPSQRNPKQIPLDAQLDRMLVRFCSMLRELPLEGRCVFAIKLQGVALGLESDQASPGASVQPLPDSAPQPDSLGSAPAKSTQ